MQDHFDKEIAERYDDPNPSEEEREELALCVERLHEWAGDGPVLEFAVGTGRVALPVAASGLKVTGIELSPAMLSVLRRKPGAGALTLVEGDMVETRLPGRFSLVFLVFNTIGNLTTQAEQVACFENAARHLLPGGRFVIENMLPPLRRYPPGASGVPFEVSPHHTGIDTLEPATQGLVSHHYFTEPDGTIRYTYVQQRYTFPAELDLMARIAGLELESRFGGWDESPFTDDSEKHVSVWRRP